MIVPAQAAQLSSPTFTSSSALSDADIGSPQTSASIEHWAPTVVSDAGSDDGFELDGNAGTNGASKKKRRVVITWDWDVEHADRKREAKADADFARHAQMEQAQLPFQVDRRLLKDIVEEKMGDGVGRITFISSGTFHKAYSVLLVTGRELVARVARRFMPRIKTESEVATMRYFARHTKIPVPEIYHYDANPYNRLGGEWILMSKAPGVPLSKVYYSLDNEGLSRLLLNTAKLLLPLFGHRFDRMGSLYLRPPPTPPPSTSPPAYQSTPSPGSSSPSLLSNVPSLLQQLEPTFASLSSSILPRSARPPPERTDTTATLRQSLSSTASSTAAPTPYFPLSRSNSDFTALTGDLRTPDPDATPTITSLATPKGLLRLAQSPASGSEPRTPNASKPGAGAGAAAEEQDKTDAEIEVQVGPIVSWPFFGSGRGDLSHSASPPEIDRGPWATTSSYVQSCISREISGVVRENEGRAVPHRLHLDPDEVASSRHVHHMDADPDDKSETSTEWDWEESEREFEGPGDSMYRDYRRQQRGAFLVSHMQEREEKVRKEMERWRGVMDKLDAAMGEVDGAEVFGIDCHDLSLENVFVDEKDHSRITCIIDWESTTTRPLWACAHLPPFLQSSPFTAKLFRHTVASLARPQSSTQPGLPSPSPSPHPGPLPASSLLAAPSSDASGTSPTRSEEPDLSALATEWLHYEAAGARLRSAHRMVEWDGWEEGLAETILGPEENEADWFKPWSAGDQDLCEAMSPYEGIAIEGLHVEDCLLAPEDGDAVVGEDSSSSESPASPSPETLEDSPTSAAIPALKPPSLPSMPVSPAVKVMPLKSHQTQGQGQAPLPPGKAVLRAFATNEEREKEKLLEATGDICGGRGGELGRRLEHWIRETQLQAGVGEVDG